MIGNGELTVPDLFVEYRVRHLIREGALVHTGDLSTMRNYSVSLVDPSIPEEQWSHEQRLAKVVKVRSLLREMMEINLSEKDVMEQLSQLDAAALGKPPSPQPEVDEGGIQALLDELLITYQQHKEQRISIMESLGKMLSHMHQDTHKE